MTSVPFAPTSGEAGAATDQYPLVESLRAHLATLHGCAQVELLETHISFVLVAGMFAYKLKKAVRLPFLDFSTLDRRRYYCEQELRLNRRYAPQLYLDVVPVTGSAANPALGGAGPAIEYAVRMRSFAQEDLASRVLLRGALMPRHIDALAALVAAFHESIARAGAESPFGTPAVIRQDALDNIDEIGRLPGAGGAAGGLDRLRGWTESESATLTGAFRGRLAGGFVRECHGDLHLDNIALVDGEITPFDGIEFNDELRWIDVMNEIAFLLMDLRYRGRPDLASRFLNAWLEHTGDYSGLAVLRYYVVYRALVRAKVACLRAAQGHLDESARAALRGDHARHLELAQSHLEPQRPAIVLTHGFSGCGKTTLSQGMLEAIGAVRIRSDIERKRLAGLPATARSGSAVAGGLYHEDMNERTYDCLLAGAGAIVAAGAIAVVDATFLRRRQREPFRELARQRGVPFAIVSFQSSAADLRARITERQRRGDGASEADLAVLEHQMATAEALAPDEQPDEIRLDTTGLLPIASERKTWQPLLDKLRAP